MIWPPCFSISKALISVKNRGWSSNSFCDFCFWEFHRFLFNSIKGNTLVQLVICHTSPTDNKWTTVVGYYTFPHSASVNRIKDATKQTRNLTARNFSPGVRLSTQALSCRKIVLVLVWRPLDLQPPGFLKMQVQRVIGTTPQKKSHMVRVLFSFTLTKAPSTSIHF